MKAVVLMTVCRRYHELERNLARVRERAEAELGYAPDVVLVWAMPEVGRLWLMRRLLDSGAVARVIGRPALAGEGDGATTHPESHNIRLGLEYIRDNYDPGSHYVVFLAADVWVQEGTLGFVADKFATGHRAAVFHWENGFCREGVWHTNFFAVALDEAYWPPVSPHGDQDVLERQWGKLLDATRPPMVFKWHNSGGRRFLHCHASESLPAFPLVPESSGGGAALVVAGSKTWYRRAAGVFKWCGRLFGLRG